MAEIKRTSFASSSSSTEKASKMWEALRKAHRAIFLLGQDNRKLQPKGAELGSQSLRPQDLCYTFRIQVTDQTYHKVVAGMKKVLQNGGVCVTLRAGDKSALHVHSSIPLEVLLQKLKLAKPEVRVEQQAVFFFNLSGVTSEGEQSVEDALNCNALGGFINAAAVSGSTLALFTNPAVTWSADIAAELFTVALTFERHQCPLFKALPSSKPYKLGVFGTWCTTQMLFIIKAALEEKLTDLGPVSVVANPSGRALTIYIQGLEHALRARSKVVGIIKTMGYRCASKNNRVVLFDTLGAHVANVHKEVKVDATQAMAAQYRDLLDPLIATPNPDQALVRTSIVNTVRNLGLAATTRGCAELVFSLNGVKCVSCAGRIRLAIQQGTHKHVSAFLNLYRNQLIIKTPDDVVEDCVPEVIKALRAIKVNAELLCVNHDLNDEPDPGTEEEYAVIQRLSGRAMQRREVEDNALEAVSDDSDAMRSQNSPVTTASFHVTGLMCQSCALLLRGTVKTVVPGITSCAVEFASRTLYISYGSETTSADEIRDRLHALGHTAALLREGEDLKLKLTDTLWANENTIIPMEDDQAQAMLDSQLLLHEWQPQPAAPEPLLELKHYAPLEETGVEVCLVPSISSAPAYHHVTTAPVQLLTDPKDKRAGPVFLSVFSQAVAREASPEGAVEAKEKGPFEGPQEAFFLLMQSPTAYGGDPQEALPAAPAADHAELPALFFTHQWTFWFDVTVDTKEKNMEDSLRPMGTFNTLQDFWRLWTNLCIGHLRDGCNLRLFRHDIQPTWEHPMNRNGGRWSARSLGKAKRVRLWTEVALALVGEQLQDNSEHHVCGVCLSSKPGGDRIEVWVDGGYEAQEKPGAGRSAAIASAAEPMDELLRKMLFPDEDKKYFFYQSHLDYIEQRKTQRGGRRAKARKQNQLGDGYEESTDDGQRRFYPDYEFTPAAAPPYSSAAGPAYPGGGRGTYGAEMRSGGVLASGARPVPPMASRFGMGQAQPYYAGKGYDGSRMYDIGRGYDGGRGLERSFEGGKSYDGGKSYEGGKSYGKPQPFSMHAYGGGYSGTMGKGAAASPFMYMPHQPMFMPPQPPPAMTPGEADNILAVHSMSGSGLTAPEPPPWSLDLAKPTDPAPAPRSTAAPLEEDDDYDPTAVGMEVGQLLEELHLEQYVPVMVQKGYEDWSSMQDLSETDLVEMGFKPGHRKRLLASLRSSH